MSLMGALGAAAALGLLASVSAEPIEAEPPPFDGSADPTAESIEAEPPPFDGSVDPAAEPLPGAPVVVETDRPARVRASASEGFGFDSADGRFRLSMGILAQLRFRVDEQEGDVDPRFSMRLARVMIQGNLWGDRVAYQLQPEFAGGVRLLDVNATVKLHPAFAIYAGQYRPWFTRGFSTILPLQALPDRGPVLDAFRIDRDVGVTFQGLPFDGRMEYYVGVLNGEGLNLQAPRNPQPLLTARLVGAPLGGLGYSQTTAGTADRDLPFRFAFAANAATNEVSRVQTMVDPTTGQPVVTPLPDLRTVVVGGDVALQGWRMTAMGEGFWRWSEELGGAQQRAWGTYGQVSGVLVRQRLELVARVGAMRLEDEAAAHLPLEPGLNVYAFGDHAKIQVRYRCDLSSVDGSCLSQGGDLQAQLWF